MGWTIGYLKNLSSVYFSEIVFIELKFLHWNVKRELILNYPPYLSTAGSTLVVICASCTYTLNLTNNSDGFIFHIPIDL